MAARLVTGLSEVNGMDKASRVSRRKNIMSPMTANTGGDSPNSIFKGNTVKAFNKGGNPVSRHAIFFHDIWPGMASSTGNEDSRP